MWLSFLRNFLKLIALFVLLPMEQPGGVAASFPRVWNMPADNPHFVGREEILDEISAIFKSAPLKTAVISGHQGFGKSQTAKHYAHQNFGQYDIVWWFRANQYLKPQFEKFALEVALHLGLNLNTEDAISAMGHERLISLVKGRIRQKNLKCLIIFDDAQTYADIEPYVLFSHEDTIHTLVTTKNANLAQNSIQIKPFTRGTSIKYINIFLPNESQKSKGLLAGHFSDCPAALALSINYIKGYPGMNIERYLNKHAKAKGSLLPNNEQEKKLGSSMDDYEADLLVAIQVNMAELRKNSEEAFHLLGLLSLFHRDEIPITLIENWVEKKNTSTDVKKLMDLINRYSFIEVTIPKKNGVENRRAKINKGAYISMQELIQKIVNTLIPLPEKKKLIDEAVQALKPSLSDRSDKMAEAILKDNNPLLHMIRISTEADNIAHHGEDLAMMRVKALDILMGTIRDIEVGKEIICHLDRDFQSGITLSKENKILYNINLSLFSALESANYERSIAYGKKALELLETEEKMYEEKIRTVANLIQHHMLSGLSDKCQKFVEMGDKLLPLSQSRLDNILYIYATTMFLLDQGEIEKTITLVRSHEYLWEKQNHYPLIRYFTINQLAEALIKHGEIGEAKNLLSQSEKYAKVFYGEGAQNNFIGKLYLLKAACQLNNSAPFESTKTLIDKGLNAYESSQKSTNKHRTQAFGYLQLGKLYHLHQRYKQAKTHYLKSEEIFDDVLKNKKIDDVSELYKQLAILGVDAIDEALTHTYLKKQMAVFGLDHPKTKEIILYLDRMGLALPY
jgi:hypothetical protein